jgi:predicted GIY-YIG superfamily endonuclease
VLQSKKDGDLYVGCTSNLKSRIELHNAKKVASTAKRAPFVLVYYEAYIDSHDAYNREQYMKTRYGKNYIKKVLSNFFISKNFLG